MVVVGQFQSYERRQIQIIFINPTQQIRSTVQTILINVYLHSYNYRQ